MRWYIVVVMVVVGWTPLLPAAGPRDAEIEKILRSTCAYWHAPGIAAAIVRDDKIVYLNGVGVRELGSDKPVTAETLFGIGSCTKAFTAAALAVLVEEGKADWNDPVRKHLPWFRLHDPLADRDVRLDDLLCHRIGLAAHDLLWYGAPWSIDESVRRMAFLERHTSFRSTYEYNNLAYLAAGLAIGEIAKQPWHIFVQERLFKPLRMNRAVFTSGEAQKAPDHASPHGHDAADKVTVIPWYSDDKQIRASGSIKTSVRDLSQWLRFQLAHGKLDGKQVLSAAALEETHTPRIPVPLSVAERAAGATQASYALGWHVSDYRGHAIHEHGGAVKGFRARIILVPRKNLGLVVLTNLQDMEIVNAAGNALLDYLLGLEKKEWNDFFAKEHRKAKAAEKERLDKLLNGRFARTKAKDLDLYVGTYSEPAYGRVTITREGDSLQLKWSSFQLPLRHFHYDTFLTPTKDLQFLLAEADLRAQTVVFEMNEDAEMSALRFLGRKFTRDKGVKKGDESPVKLGKLPDLRLVPRPPVTKDQAERIKERIAGLAALDKPDFGLSSTLSGDNFAPVPGRGHAGMFILANHGLRPSQNLKALVTLGPDALPFLLDALDNQTPTKIAIKRKDGFGAGLREFGAMWHAAELDLNPVNPAEHAIYKAREVKPRDEEDAVESYTVKVGDVCFVAIGQIVGRSYQAVRYQPSACVVLNSPTHDAKLCAEVRAIWKAKDPRSKLFDSLRADYGTEGKSPDWWSIGNNLQCGAALRLMFYFEKEAAPLLVGRLTKLDVGKDKDLDSFHRRCEANGVRADEFIKAVAWSKNRLIRDALIGVFKRAGDVDALLAALPAVEDKELIRSRLEPLVAALPADEDGPYGHGFQFLLALAQRTPETARAVFERYLRDASAQRCHTVCLVLREVRPSWDAELLRPLLNDTRTWGWTYAVEPHKNEPRRPIRVCDEAAVTLSQNHPKLKFTQAGEHADLDKQIAAIRKQLAQKK